MYEVHKKNKRQTKGKSQFVIFYTILLGVNLQSTLHDVSHSHIDTYCIYSASGLCETTYLRHVLTILSSTTFNYDVKVTVRKTVNELLW